ncbi:helix-turn-helix transcriptional regulator [uncultured Psychroserpens sp.]|uniref:helix-turn-helix domain-containing protein n=1 Tax=uncultured Psychroserpens sp. TaxID=255436 RepID=UPI0026074C1E|nr:helix-turn-helix transcriptional regulator [uncultured Psychroserpens sp.]
MNFRYSKHPEQGNLVLTDFNCASFEKRLGVGDYYKIIWAKDTAINMGIDGYSITLEKNQVLFCTPFNMIQIEPFSKGAISIIFDREFYCIRDHDHEVSCNGFLFLGSSAPAIVDLTEKERKSFELHFMFFEEEFETKDHVQGEMLRVLLKRLLIKSVRLLKKTIIDPSMEQSKVDIIRQFNLLVEANFKEKHKVSDYANLLNKSPKTISNLFTKYNNKTPLQVINDRIILEAKKLLLLSEKSSKEIGYELGFSEASHFSKFFKNQVGTSPIYFKKNTLNIY